MEQDKQRIIKDAIYGYIDVPSLLSYFIDEPEFQKLRRIKQLGNVDRVYPGATHTRFEHSLGVMHLAGILSQKLGIDKEYTELIQLAGLYHDIGHLPYSHLFDTVLGIIKPEGIPIHHELRSVDIFLEVSSRLKLLTKEQERFICACILGEPLEEEGYEDKKYMFQIVSSPVDVDKLDYLCRDAYYLGMMAFKGEYIIRNARISKNKTLVFRENARKEIESMFITREKMHEEVYQHDVCLEYDTLYICMILRVKDLLEYKDLCDYKLETLLMTDTRTKYIYNRIQRRNTDHSECDMNHFVRVKHIVPSGSIKDIEWFEEPEKKRKSVNIIEKENVKRIKI